MGEYDASDPKAIRKAAKAARQVEAERELVVVGLMSTPSGRSYVHDILLRCHVFTPSFNFSAMAMAFAEGERNVALQLLGDVMRCAPDQYIQMMREVNDRSTADDRRGGNRSNANGRDRPADSPAAGDTASGGVTADYDLYGDAGPDGQEPS